MPTSNAEFNAKTTGQTIVTTYGAAGKIVLITGANPLGIGGTTATSLAMSSPKLLILAGRSSSKLIETAENVRKVDATVQCKLLSLDLSSQKSCRAAAKEILEDEAIPQIDILINNAGVMEIPERTLSSEGIEMQFATNHIGHFLFTNLILPKLEVAAKTSSPRTTRIVNLSSRAVLYSPVRFSDWNFTKTEMELPKEEHMAMEPRLLWNEIEDKPYVPSAAYGQSKSANVLFTVELNKRLYSKTGVLSVSVHPGGIQTELGRSIDQEKMQAGIKNFQAMMPGFFMKDLEQGCSTTLVAALDPKILEEDVFLADCQIADWAPKWSTDLDKAKQLWKLSEELVGEEFCN